MKTFMLVLMMLAAPAMAETITLSAENCGHFRVCSNVPNDTTAVVSINANPAYTSVAVVLDGVTYTTATGNSSTITAMTLYAADGTSIVMDATFAYHRSLVRSGHNFYVWYWELTGGDITR